MFRTVLRASLLASATAAAVGVAVPSALASPSPTTPATFEGRTIDLSKGWGDATACHVAEDGTTCYRTEEDMIAAIEVTPSVVSLLACSPSVQLWDLTNKSGATVLISTTNTVVSLSGLSFDNRTDSYTVGGCNATFYDTTTGSTVYPGATGAGASANSMASGWSNRVGSVRITA